MKMRIKQTEIEPLKRLIPLHFEPVGNIDAEMEIAI